jgi:chromosome segregation ATPase
MKMLKCSVEELTGQHQSVQMQLESIQTQGVTESQKPNMEIAEKDADLANNRNLLETRDAEIVALNDQHQKALQGNKEIIASMKNEQSSQITEIRETLAHKDSELATLKEQLVAKDSEIGSSHEKIESLSAAISKFKTKLKEIVQTLKEKEKEITDLKQSHETQLQQANRRWKHFS